MTEASYKTSYHISIQGEAHIIEESLAKPTLKDVVSCILVKKSAQADESISLSNNTALRRIVDIAEDIENELISQLYACDAYASQMDETTDLAGLAILIVFLRYDINTKIENNLLFCKCLELHTT